MMSNNPVKSSSASEMLAVSLAKMAWRCKDVEVHHTVGVTNNGIATFVTAWLALDQAAVSDALAEAKTRSFKNADLAGLAAGGDPPDRLANPDEDPLERYAAGPREESADWHAGPPELPAVRDPVSYPVVYRVHAPVHTSSSTVLVDSDAGFTARTESAHTLPISDTIRTELGRIPI